MTKWKKVLCIFPYFETFCSQIGVKIGGVRVRIYSAYRQEKYYPLLKSMVLILTIVINFSIEIFRTKS